MVQIDISLQPSVIRLCIEGTDECFFDTTAYILDDKSLRIGCVSRFMSSYNSMMNDSNE